jgi:regulator of nucleoside diphosphate kinase
MSHLDVDYRESRKPATQDYSRRPRPVKSGNTLVRQETPIAHCCLTEPDVRLLEEAVAINGGIDTPIGQAVAEKLGHTELRNTIPDDYVTLNSHVIFRVDGGPPLSRVLVHWDKFCVPRLHLSLHMPRGITLLGMKAGSEAVVYWRNGVTEKIKVESVTHASRAASSWQSRSRGEDHRAGQL